MQNPTDYPRLNLTTAQVVQVIQNSASITIDKGMELLDMDLNVLDDISDSFGSGSSVTRDSFATLHASGNFNISRELDWGEAIVRPYTVLSDGTITAKFYMGAYYVSVPTRDFSTTPPVYAVTGFDILNGLDDLVGDAYTVSSGSVVADAIEAIIQSRGYTQYSIDRTNNATLPTDKVWAFDSQTTWLKIINDLCAVIGYQGIYSDWWGVLRVKQYEQPIQRNIEWVYDQSPTTSMISFKRDMQYDYFAAPNRWVFYLNSQTNGATPVEGAGKYTFVNQSDGPTSVDSRNGRVISKITGVDAADQTSLVNLAQVTIDADKSVTHVYQVNTLPNPLHWHFDRLVFTDIAVGSVVDAQATKWVYDFDGADMQHEWRLI